VLLRVRRVGSSKLLVALDATVTRIWPFRDGGKLRPWAVTLSWDLASSLAKEDAVYPIPSTLSFALLALPALAGGQVFVVDAASGPGRNRRLFSPAVTVSRQDPRTELQSETTHAHVLP